MNHTIFKEIIPGGPKNKNFNGTRSGLHGARVYLKRRHRGKSKWKTNLKN